MVVYPNAAPSTLSDSHRRMLLDESGMDPGVAEERGYHTARRRSEAPEILKGYQRKPGLVLPTLSPDGITRSCQLRPDKPRKDRKGKPLKYETPGGSGAILDVHPRMCEEVRSGTGDLWITEASRKPTLSRAGTYRPSGSSASGTSSATARCFPAGITSPYRAGASASSTTTTSWSKRACSSPSNG